jgi:transposase
MRSPLVVGVDVHRKDNHFHCLDPTGQTIATFKQRNNRPGTERAIAQLTTIVHHGQFDGIRLAAEATNWYWLPFFQLLASDPTLNQCALELYAFNPRITAKYRDTFLDLDKDDPEDALLIADRLRIGRELPHPFSFDAQALALRTLTRLRHRLTHELTMVKLYTLNGIYLKASEYTLAGTAAFDKPFGPTSVKLLQEFATLDELAAMPLDELAAWVEKQGRGSFADVERTAQKLHTIAQNSYQLPSPLSESVDLSVRLNLQHIAQLERLRTQLDHAIGEQLAAHPNTLTSIPGIGRVYAAGIVAEIGDITRFGGDEAKVAKMAGLKWRKNKSADRASEETPLTRRGNVYLRYYLCEAANSVRMHDVSYAAYYEKKHTEVPKHKHKRAVTLTARKLVRLIVRLLTTNEPYQVRRQAETTNAAEQERLTRRLARRPRPTEGAQ